MHQDDVRQLFAYVAAPLAIPSSSGNDSSSSGYESSDGEDGDEPSILWTHNNNQLAGDDINEPPDDNIPAELSNNMEGVVLTPIAEDETHQDDTSEPALPNPESSSDLLLKELIKLLKKNNKSEGKSKSKAFRVPRFMRCSTVTQRSWKPLLLMYNWHTMNTLLETQRGRTTQTSFTSSSIILSLDRLFVCGSKLLR